MRVVASTEKYFSTYPPMKGVPKKLQIELTPLFRKKKLALSLEDKL